MGPTATGRSPILCWVSARKDKMSIAFLWRSKDQIWKATTKKKAIWQSSWNSSRHQLINSFFWGWGTPHLLACSWRVCFNYEYVNVTINNIDTLIGFKCSLFKMTLVADGVYLPLLIKLFSLVEEVHEMALLPLIVESLMFVKVWL